jgi:hypothetical protein
VAHVLVARYADHLPLYRQTQMMARQGVILERSTLSFWMGYAAAEVAPVVARLREIMLASTGIFADETVYRRFQCRACGKQFKERRAGSLIVSSRGYSLLVLYPSRCRRDGCRR